MAEVLQKLQSRFQEMLEPRYQAWLADARERQRNEDEFDLDTFVDEALRGWVTGRQPGLRKTWDTLPFKQVLYCVLLGYLDEVFVQMEDAHIPVLREQLCFVRSHELSDVKRRLHRELLFARENVSTESSKDVCLARFRDYFEARERPLKELAQRLAGTMGLAHESGIDSEEQVVNGNDNGGEVENGALGRTADSRTDQRIVRSRSTPERQPERLSKAEKDILEVIREAGQRLTTKGVLAELERKQGAASQGTAKIYLAGLVRRKLLTNRQDVTPRGYGLPEWE